MSIRVLPVHLVNKIAAGEVIERPASVVKELVENAIDAGATRIEVAIEDGGRKLIAVSDDGGGMTQEDLSLAFVPHATSKIAQEDDLFRIATMGFRGEALASIAAISHAHIRTRRRDDTSGSGFEMEASGEETGTVKPCPAAPGTTVTIRDLFFNTPARRKFMRTVNTEMGAVTEQVTRLSLPHPQVAFRLTHNGRETIKLPAAATTLQRVSDLFGAELAATLMPMVGPKGSCVAGLTCKPAAGRSTTQMQYLFLNGRYIRDRSISHALKEAYRGLMDPNRQPVAMLFLTLDPAEVDVNVHPTKIEVRFRDSQAVHSAVLGALRDTLNRANLSPGMMLGGEGVPPSSGMGGSPAPSDIEQRRTASPNDTLAEHKATASPEMSLTGLQGIAPTVLDPGAEASQDDQRRQSLKQAMADFFRSAPPPHPKLGFSESAPPHRPSTESLTTPAESLSTGDASSPKPAGCAPWDDRAPSLPAMQIHNAYIVAPCPEGLLIVDQHALHERLMYNDIKRRIERGALAGQRLLIPPVVNVTPAGAHVLAARADLLALLGIEVASFGPTSVAIQQFPSLLADRGISPQEFLGELVDKLLENESAETENLLEELLSVLACKAAVKAGDPLSPGEIESLLARRLEADKSSSCPHGRPTTLTISFRELEKQFKRT